MQTKKNTGLPNGAALLPLGSTRALDATQHRKIGVKTLYMLHIYAYMHTHTHTTPVSLGPRESTSWQPLSDSSQMIHQLSITTQFLKTVGGTYLLHLPTPSVYKIGTHF